MRLTQRELSFTRRGGRREGAGRPKGERVSHGTRARFARATPVHVTLRVREHVWNLRSQRSYRRIRRCFAKARDRFGVRIIHFNVLGNHLHLIVEAESDAALSRAMQGLLIRLAKQLNAMMARTGSVFADHYRADLKASPTELCNAIRYVLGNAEHHYGEASLEFASATLSSDDRARFTAAPTSWLLRVGWRKARTQAAAVAELLGERDLDC